MRFLRSWTFRVCAILVAVLCLYYWGTDWLAEKRWQEYVREARARADRWTLAELRPAPVPAEQDGALLPIFAGSRPALPLLRNVPYNLSKGPKRADGGPRSIDWNRVRYALPGYRLGVDPGEADDLRAIDQAARPFQPLIDELCASKAVAGNWGDDIWSAREHFHLPYLEVVMPCFRLLHFRANLDIALGRSADARRALEAHLRLAKVVGTMPTLLMSLVSLSGTSTAHDVIWHGLQAGAWDDETLRSFAAEFSSANAIGSFLWSMETERAYSRAITEHRIGDARLVSGIVTFSNPIMAKIDPWLLRVRASRRPWWRENQIWIERSQDELLSTLDGEAQVWGPIQRVYDPDNLSASDREMNLLLAATTMSSLPSFLHKTIWVHANNKMAGLACALELCRRATGRYPEALEALVPDYLPRLPVDPVSGSAFKYRVQPDGTYLLYSLGMDREDQGGRNSGNTDRDASDPDWRWWAPSVQPVGSSQDRP